MADVHTKAQRSWNMSRIRGKGNATTEARLASLLRQQGIKGWRRHLPLPGRPDFAFPRERVVVFVDGCFWHHCPRCNWMPTSNVVYWQRKFARNRARDKATNRQLRLQGWKVLRVWEHALKERPTLVMARIRRSLSSATNTGR